MSLLAAIDFDEVCFMLQSPYSFYASFRCGIDVVSFTSSSRTRILSMINSFPFRDDYEFYGEILYSLFHLNGTYSGDTHTDAYYDFDDFLKILED